MGLRPLSAQDRPCDRRRRDGPCILLSMSSQENQAFGPYGEDTANDIARKHGASEVTTQDAEQADANLPESQPTREGWLPG